MHQHTRQPKTFRQYLALYLTGMGMGAADTVPGVSGGTVAFVRGIYTDLLNAIKSFNFDLLKKALRLDFKGVIEQVPWRFLITLGLGILTAVLSLARLVSYLMENQRVYLFAFFFGLVLASATAVAAKLKNWSLVSLLALLAGGLASFTIVGLVPAEGSHDLLTLFVSGFFAIMAMILPGISGSSILLILGQYEYVLNAVKQFDLPPLIALGLGCVAGIALFSRVLSWLLGRFPQTTIAALIGFVLGSLRAVWPWQQVTTVMVGGAAEPVRVNFMPDLAAPEFVIALALCAAGFLLVSLVDHLESGQNPVFRLVRRPRQQPEDAPAV